MEAVFEELSPVAALVEETLAAAHDRFQARAPDALIFAPGRVNLIGEHTDYTGGLVLPMTLPYGTCIAAFSRDDGAFSIDAVSLDEKYSAAEIVTSAAAIAAAPLFARYALGAFAGAKGADLVVLSSLPLGAGLSSSASYLCALLLARAGLEQRVPQPWDVAKEARRIENTVIGLASGILDPAAVCLSSASSALFLDCKTLQSERVPLPEDIAILVSDSGASRSLASSAYNARYETCMKATSALGVEALGDLKPDALEAVASSDALDSTTKKRVRHVVTENARVRAFVEAMRAKDENSAGALLNASHASLRDDYEVSSDALNALADTMRSVEGVLGARLCGAGFGGCCVALVEATAAEAAALAIDAAWREQTGHDPKTIIAVPAGPARSLSLAPQKRGD